MGCKLLEIMADGMYAVFHRLEAFLKKKVDAQAVTVGWPSNSHFLCINLFLGKPQIYGKQHTTHLPLFLIIYSPFANFEEFFGAHLLFVSITPHIVATVKNYTKFCIFRCGQLFLILKFRLTFKLILKINVCQYKIQQILHA